jgi:hypothetical protein
MAGASVNTEGSGVMPRERRQVFGNEIMNKEIKIEHIG